MLRKGPASPVDAIFGEMKGALALLFAIGFVVNLLQLTGSVYMMQVYDRVLTSQSEATLLALTLISLFLIALYGIAAKQGDRLFRVLRLMFPSTVRP
jgi:ABC-type protease/lipase transport system fused ATPase/permease subunit